MCLLSLKTCETLSKTLKYLIHENSTLGQQQWFWMISRQILAESDEIICGPLCTQIPVGQFFGADSEIPASVVLIFSSNS